MPTMKRLAALIAGIGLIGLAGSAQATPSNQPPPTGNVIYDLTGQSIIGTYQTANVSFVANQTNTNLSFAFREDPAFLDLGNVSLTTGGGSNLLTNGDFSAGPLNASAPTGWSYLNTFGATFGGEVNSGCGPNSGNCYSDGAVQAYDAISQAVATTIGTTYDLSFAYADTLPGGTYQPLSTNGDVTGTGGNGRDMFVYAGALPVRTVPEPATVALVGVGLLGLGLGRRKRKA